MIVVVVVVVFCNTSVARLLDRPAEGSDVVCYCSDQSVSERGPFAVKNLRRWP